MSALAHDPRRNVLEQQGGLALQQREVEGLLGGKVVV
jgi:hypothetical protein